MADVHYSIQWNTRLKTVIFESTSSCRSARHTFRIAYLVADQPIVSRQVEIEADGDMRLNPLVHAGFRPDRPMDYRNDRTQPDRRISSS